MAYTPELSQEDSAALRRMAWAIGSPMTVTLSFIIRLAAKHADKNKVCAACRDQKLCPNCLFQKMRREQ